MTTGRLYRHIEVTTGRTNPQDVSEGTTFGDDFRLVHFPNSYHQQDELSTELLM